MQRFVCASSSFACIIVGMLSGGAGKGGVVHVCLCVRARARARVRACVRACVCMRVCGLNDLTLV